MADIDYMHIAAIMNAAMPYVNIKTRKPMNLIATLFAFMESMQSFRQPPDLGACGYDEQQMNLEGLLTAIRPHCNEKEQPMIDQILGALNAKRMFDIYNTYMNMTKSMDGFDGFPFQGAESTYNTAEETTDDAVTEGTIDTAAAEETIDLAAAKEGIDFATAKEGIDFATAEEGIGFATGEEGIGFAAGKEAAGETAQTFNTGSSDTPIPNSSNHIMEMLKSMIPPEQMDTFSNLSMLFNSTSYDNNNNAEQI